MTFVAKFKIKEQDTIKAKFTLDVKPKKVSQLENDLHFQTDEQVASTVQTAVEEVTIETDAKITVVNETINNLSNVVEQNYSELDNKITVNHQEITDHISNKNNPHEVTKAQVGLGNVDNTSDLNKPISTATQNALDTKVDRTSVANRVYGTDANGNQTTYSSETFGKVDDVRVDGTSVVTNKIANLGSMANEDADDYSTTTKANSLYAEKSLETTVSTHISNKNNPHEVTKAQVGLGNVDNTSDLNKPISTATQNALDTLSNTVSSNYTTLNTRITNEAATLNTAITTEETNRQNADNNLQSQIDAITSASDVTDIVGTYAELQAYDTTGLPDKSIIKVLQDESRNNETTYYRWVITNNVGAWVLIGEEGPYYTKSEADGKFVDQSTTVNGKALSSNIVLTSSDVGALSSSTTINDLTTLAQQNALNSGITSAKVNLIDTSIQPGDNISQLTNDANYISGINQSDVINALGYTPYNATNPDNYATETYVDTGLATKQNTLVSGTNIKTINNETVLGSGNIDIQSSTVAYGTSSTAGNVAEKEVSIPEITELNVGQILYIKPSNSATVANLTIKLNNFTAYPIRYNNGAITTTTDDLVWSQNFVSQFIFDGTYWQFAGRGYDKDTTYTQNILFDRGNFVSGSGTYAITRYSICLQKPDMTWEKVTNTEENYSLGTDKTVNTHGFLLNGEMLYYSNTAVLANGASSSANTMYRQYASFDIRYSANSTGTGYTAGDYIYLVGTIGVDGLFYLDSTWWTNTLPSTNDGKIYVKVGKYISGVSVSLELEHPAYYHNGTRICLYQSASNKQDTLVSGTNIKTINNQSLLGSGDITIQGGGAVDSVNGYTGVVVLTASDVGALATSDVTEYTAQEVETLWGSI